MTDEHALLRAIAAAPGEDLPRLVFADWLDEHGQPDRAEFIRVQCRLAAREARHPEREALERREQELLRDGRATWVAREWPGAPTNGVRYERGFAVEVSFRGQDRGDALARAVAADPGLALLAALDLGQTGLTKDGLPALAASPFLRRLTLLDLRDNVLPGAALQPLARFPGLVQLLRLYGQAPVEGEGRVGPHEFYFRARHEAWSFGLSETPGTDAADVCETTGTQFYLEEGYGSGPFDASYMPPDEAVAIIRRCGEEYRKNRGIG